MFWRPRRTQPTARQPSGVLPATKEGDRVYAIGDIHGRYDLLRELMAMIREHSRKLPPATSTYIIVLGDLIDRGPESAQVLKFLHQVQQRSDSLIVLMGNHEQLMLRALRREPGMLRAWMRIGGRQTLRSFGIEPPSSDDDQMEALRQIASAIPEHWTEWIASLPLMARSGDYLFCHAGIRPGVPLRKQTQADLLWIRDEFLEESEPLGVVVVHGHSIALEVEVRNNRIGIDTGAYKTGVLTALYLEGTERQILSTTPPDVGNTTERDRAELGNLDGGASV